MQAIYRKPGMVVLVFAMLVLAPTKGGFAHGGGNWNDFRIDRVIDDVHDRVVKAQREIADIIGERAEVSEWPVPHLQRRRDELIGLKDEIDEILEHFVLDGLNIDDAGTLRAEPRVGRSLAASRALNAVVALIERASQVEDRSGFIAEFYGRGLAAWMYESLDANRDKIELYAILVEADSP